MADRHPGGNPKLVEQDKKNRREGDHEPSTGNVRPDEVPGKGKPDKEEGGGTVRNQRR